MSSIKTERNHGANAEVFVAPRNFEMFTALTQSFAKYSKQITWLDRGKNRLPNDIKHENILSKYAVE